MMTRINMCLEQHSIVSTILDGFDTNENLIIYNENFNYKNIVV